jgi:23S rRNA (uracil1939-C5)-methyltransferase
VRRRSEPVLGEALAESLDREGRGVAHIDGKAVFIEGALPGERVEYEAYRRKASYELGQVTKVLAPSAGRVDPRCPWFGRCGGCSLQHAALSTQVAAKQRVLEDALWHIARLHPGRMLPPIAGPAWGYRHRARLSVRLVPKKGGVLVGFHERKSSYVAEMDSCEVLPRALSDLIPRLRELVERLSIRARLPQIEVAVGDAVTVLVLRVLEPPGAADETLLRGFADEHAVQLWLQPRGPETAQPFWPLDAPALDYALPEFGVRVAFQPTDFTQVNHAANRMLVRRALRLLDPQPGERIGDFFCGLGNFTLPIARSGAQVFGVEGSAALVERAKANAVRNGLAENIRFTVANLFDPEACRETLKQAGTLDAALIDPPREGAIELIKVMAERPAGDSNETELRRLVYVSCDPATLARDAAVLVQTQNYQLEAAGIVNMFPQTSHVESIATFSRP